MAVAGGHCEGTVIAAQGDPTGQLIGQHPDHEGGELVEEIRMSSVVNNTCCSSTGAELDSDEAAPRCRPRIPVCWRRRSDRARSTTRLRSRLAGDRAAGDGESKTARHRA